MTEEKIRFQIRISPDTDERIKAAMEIANCRSQNEFVEKAVRFYCAYIQTGNNLAYLPSVLSTALTGVVQDSENRIARLLFKLAVEMDVMMNVLAAAVEIDREAIREQRGRSVQNVKKTNGQLSFEEHIPLSDQYLEGDG